MIFIKLNIYSNKRKMRCNIGYQKQQYRFSCVTTLWNNAL